MKKIVIASSNINKINEISKILLPLGFDVKGFKDNNFLQTIKEEGSTYAENALTKARAVCKKTKKIAIGDDSGLEVKALNGAPGVLSRRFAGVDATDEMNNALLLQKLKNSKDRSARFVCAICVYFPNDEYIVIEDTCDGKISTTKRGTNGFGYDPYFIIKDQNKTMAELSMEEKNLISHRAKCIRKLASYLNLRR